MPFIHINFPGPVSFNMNHFRWLRAFNHGVLARLAAGILLLCCLPGSLPGVQASIDVKADDSVVALLADARAYRARAEYEAAIIQIKNALKQAPDNPDARLLLGEVYLEAGRAAAAEQELRRARAAGVNAERVALSLANAYFQQREFELVLELAATRLGSQMEVAKMRALESRVYLEYHRLADAARALEEARQLDPFAPEVILQEIRLQLANDKVSAAAESAARLIEQQPNDAEAWFLQGEILRHDGELAAAVESYTRSITLRPGQIAPRISRGACLMDLGEDDQALEDINFVRSRARGNVTAAYLQALLLARRGQYADARAAMEEAATVIATARAEILLSNPRMSMIAGIVYSTRGNAAEAEVFLRRYLEVAPQHLPTRKLLGRTLLTLSRPEEALAVLMLAKEDAWQDSAFLSLLASAQMGVGHVDEAVELFEKAARLEPDASGLQEQLALARFASGAEDTAADELQTLVTSGKNPAWTSMLLALLYMEQGEDEDALALARSLRDKIPGNAFPIALEAMIYWRSNDIDRARDSFARALEVNPGFLPAEYALAEIDKRQGRLGDARQRYLGILNHKPDDIRAMLELTELALREEKTGEAIDRLERIRRLRPDMKHPQLVLARLYFQEDKNDQARRIIDELMAKHPNDLALLEFSGRIAMTQGEVKRAQSAFLRMAGLSQTPGQLVRIAHLQNSVRDPVGADQSLKRAHLIDGKYLVAPLARVRLALQQGDVAGARVLANYLRDVYPQSRESALARGDIRLSQGDYAGAIQVFEAALKKDANTELTLKLAESHRRAGDEATALAILQQWEEVQPTNVQLLAALGEHYARAGQRKRAIEYYQRCLTQEPDNAAVANNMAILYQDIDIDKALVYARQAYVLAPQSPAVLDTYGWMLVEHGDAGKAVKLLRLARDRLPAQPTIRYHLGEAYYRVNRQADAIHELQAALGLDRNFPEATQARELLARLQAR